jgi:hypothetical protein
MVKCSHPADHLEVRAISMDRDLMDKPISIYSEDPTDFIFKKSTPGQTHYRVMCFCTKCKQELYIYGDA